VVKHRLGFQHGNRGERGKGKHEGDKEPIISLAAYEGGKKRSSFLIAEKGKDQRGIEIAQTIKELTFT